MAIQNFVTEEPRAPVDLANLKTIHYDKLFSGCSKETSRLLSACAQYGFFYLDLSSGALREEKYLDVVDGIFEVSKEYLARPLEAKLKDIIVANGTSDTCGLV